MNVLAKIDEVYQKLRSQSGTVGTVHTFEDRATFRYQW